MHVELTEEERHINDTNKAWHATESFPEPDETSGRPPEPAVGGAGGGIADGFDAERETVKAGAA